MLRNLLKKIKRSFVKTSITDKELARLIDKENPIILDIGCNDGSDTFRFLNLFKKAQVYCFEPDPRARKRYKAKISDTRAKLFSCAISGSDGFADFYVSDVINSPKYPEGWDLSGSIRKPKLHLQLYPWCKFNKKIKVQTKKLDTWCKEEGINFIDFVWADVQGTESDLIKGGIGALRRTRYLYTEYSNQELYEGQINLAEILRLLPEFKIVRKYPNDVLLKNKHYDPSINSGS